MMTTLKMLCVPSRFALLGSNLPSRLRQATSLRNFHLTYPSPSRTTLGLRNCATDSIKKPLVLKSFAEYRSWRKNLRNEGKSVGFVPTMGALHDGHLSLARQAREQNDSVVVSIFVNPAQFAPHEDLNAYPRTVPKDVELLTGTGAVDVVLVPSVKEIYPSGITLNVKDQVGTFVEVLGLGARMEGTVRPHFFRGVTTVVSKLLNVTQPDTLYLGQKDFQQASIVRHMIHDLLIPVNLVVAATIREPRDNLAMSSRNRYLNNAERAVAGTLYEGLHAGRRVVFSKNGSRCTREEILTRAEQTIRNVIDREASKKDGVPMQLEYLSLVDPWTLDELDALEGVRETDGDPLFTAITGERNRGAYSPARSRSARRD